MNKSKPIRSQGNPWPDPDFGPWKVVTLWAVVDTRIECVGFEFIAADPNFQKPIVPSWMRDLRLAEMIEIDRVALNEQAANLLKRAREAHRREAGLPTEQPGDRTDRTVEIATPPTVRRSGRPIEHGDDHYKKVAGIYSEAHAAGRPPVIAVQAEENVSYSTASRWVTEARRRGHLAPTRQGKPRGEL